MTPDLLYALLDLRNVGIAMNVSRKQLLTRFEGGSYYSSDRCTRLRFGGRSSVLTHRMFAVLQFEHGNCLSHRIWLRIRKLN